LGKGRKVDNWALGKRKKGRQTGHLGKGRKVDKLGTLRRTVGKEIKYMDKTWNEISWMVQDSNAWRRS
jgi:hypothetical protein